MQKIKKNLSGIQQQFQKLKQVHKNNEIPIKIGQVAEIMTHGVINQNQVNQYLQKVKNESQAPVDENWMDMSIQSMILFFDKIIKHRNLKKPQEGSKKERRNILSWQKIKTKMSNKQAHQNPYRPHRMGKQGNSQSSDGDYTLGTMNFGSDTNILSHIKQKLDESSTSQLQEQQFCQLMDAMNAQAQKSLKYKSKKSLQEQLNSDLPTDFASLPLKERFFFLKTNYNKKKTLLQRKFDSIYSHYRKEMYIKRETFRTNENLMLDLKTFLKYYREFQIAKKYKVAESTNHFKKLAINGIWLDVQNFFQLHYLLAELILNSDEKEIQQRLKNQNKQMAVSKSPQQKKLKRLLTKTTKIIMQNILKLKDLEEIVSDEKVKKLLNDNRGKATVKRIVEVHSGFIKEDILQRLKQRIQQKKKKEDSINRLKSSSLKLKTLSSQKGYLNQEQYKSIKANPSFRSIYRQLLLPNLSPSEMKNASIYSSLQLLNIHKEKEKLRQLISEDDNQKYLQAYFKKQKVLNSLFKSTNKLIIKTQSQTPKGFQLELSNYKSIAPKSQRKQSNVKKSLSLPRMKFT